jgi:hypothetical protein
MSYGNASQTLVNFHDTEDTYYPSFLPRVVPLGDYSYPTHIRRIPGFGTYVLVYTHPNGNTTRVISASYET